MAGITSNCKICGKEFKPGNGRRKICSDECKHKSHLANERKYLAKHREEIREKQRAIYADPERREKIRAYQRGYQTTHRKELNAKQNAKYREKQLAELRKTMPSRKSLLPLSMLPKSKESRLTA